MGGIGGCDTLRIEVVPRSKGSLVWLCFHLVVVDGPDPQLRMALAGSHLIGLLFTRELIGIDTLEQVTSDELVEAVAPAIATYIEP